VAARARLGHQPRRVERGHAPRLPRRVQAHARAHREAGPASRSCACAGPARSREGHGGAVGGGERRPERSRACAGRGASAAPGSAALVVTNRPTCRPSATSRRSSSRPVAGLRAQPRDLTELDARCLGTERVEAAAGPGRHRPPGAARALLRPLVADLAAAGSCACGGRAVLPRRSRARAGRHRRGARARRPRRREARAVAAAGVVIRRPRPARRSSRPRRDARGGGRGRYDPKSRSLTAARNWYSGRMDSDALLLFARTPREPVASRHEASQPPRLASSATWATRRRSCRAASGAARGGAAARSSWTMAAATRDSRAAHAQPILASDAQEYSAVLAGPSWRMRRSSAWRQASSRSCASARCGARRRARRASSRRPTPRPISVASSAAPSTRCARGGRDGARCAGCAPLARDLRAPFRRLPRAGEPGPLRAVPARSSAHDEAPRDRRPGVALDMLASFRVPGRRGERRAGAALQELAEQRPRARGRAAWYLDPPYTADQYSRFYHLLETLARGDRPGIDSVKARYRSDRFRSAFSLRTGRRASCAPCCSPCASRARKRTSSSPTPRRGSHADELRAAASARSARRLLEMPHVYSTQGKATRAASASGC